MIISATFVAFGWRKAIQKRYDVHRKLMKTAAWLGAGFFVSYALDSFFVGDTLYGGPARYADAYQIFLQIHVFLATVAGIFGIVTISAALREKFALHRRIAPYTAILWLLAAATGLVVYLVLFVIFPQGPTMHNILSVLLKTHKS